MARPGFVLDVDDRTPPLLVHEGAGFRLEKFPLGTQVIYPADPLARIKHLDDAIDEVLGQPTDAAPLREQLRPGMKLTIAFSDISVPVPPMRKPDIRGRIIEHVLSLAAAAGVDDVELIAATGLNRRITDAEMLDLLGERVFRSFHADGKLTNHDAEDTGNLTVLGQTEPGPAGAADVATDQVEINRRVAESDLLVNVVVVAAPSHGGAGSIITGLGSTRTISAQHGLAGLGDPGVADRLGKVVADRLTVFQIEAAVDNNAFPSALEFCQQREWEWSIRDQATFLGVRHALALAPIRARRRMFNSATVDYGIISVSAGDLGAVHQQIAAVLAGQQQVEVNGQSDVLIAGIPDASPYSVGSILNPLLAAWLGLGVAFNSHTGQPVVRKGGAIILYHPARYEFNPRHHPSYVDFFSDVLPTSTDARVLAEKFEPRFATDPWYSHLYRTSNAYHGVHPFHLWYQMAGARQHCSDIVWVSADRSSMERMGFRAASTLADALEMVSSSVGRSPKISYLHTPPQLIAEVR